MSFKSFTYKVEFDFDFFTLAVSQDNFEYFSTSKNEGLSNPEFNGVQYVRCEHLKNSITHNKHNKKPYSSPRLGLKYLQVILNEIKELFNQTKM